MTTEIIYRFGYIGLFVISFLSATLVPLASEAFVTAMPLIGYDPTLVLVFATSGNFLGSLVNYFLGFYGRNFLLARFMRIQVDALRKAERFYARWGAPVLLFAWLPIIGDPLTVVAGMLRLDLRKFCFWTLIGKTIRYLVILELFSLR